MDTSHKTVHHNPREKDPTETQSRFRRHREPRKRKGRGMSYIDVSDSRHPRGDLKPNKEINDN